MTAVYAIDDIIIGVYRVKEILEGGMGIIYVCEVSFDFASPEVRQAASKMPERMEVIKSFHREYSWSPNQLYRIRREALTWISLLPHPHVVQARSFDLNTGYPLIIIEHMSGGNLRSLMTHGTLSLEQIFELALQVCSGMQYLWEAVGLLHRDLKPENILLSDKLAAKVTDFGISKPWLSVDSEDGSQLPSEFLPKEAPQTHTDILGTVPYMAPESFVESGATSPASDIYSFGIVLYEMLTGTLPFMGPTYKDFVSQHRSSYPVPPSRLSDVPPSVDVIIERALHKDPNARYQTFDQLYSAVVSLADYHNCQTIEPERPSFESLEDSLDSTDWSGRCYAFQQLEMFKEARKCAERGLELDPDNARLVSNLGYCCLAEGRPITEVVSLSERAVELDPTDGYLRKNLASAYERDGQIDRSLDAYRKYVELEPKAIAGHRILAIRYWKLGQSDEFERSLARVSALLPSGKYPGPRDILQEAIKFEESSIIPAARMLYDKAKTTFPDSSFVWYNLGVFHQKEREFDEALACYEKTLELNMDFQHAMFNKAIVLLELGRRDEAIESLKKQKLIPMSNMSVLLMVPDLMEDLLMRTSSIPPHIL